MSIEESAAHVEHVLPAPPPIVYEEWLNPEALADWMCPRPARPTSISVEARVGGAFRFEINEEGRDFFVTGRYLALAAPHRLTFSWSCSTWSDPTRESIVTVELRPHGDGETLMVIHHTLLPRELIANHEAGWAQISVQLTRSLITIERRAP